MAAESDGIATDAALVHRARDGDEAAAQELFERHTAALRTRVHALLPKLLRRRVTESEIVQEAYLTAFVRLADFEDRGDGSFRRWLSKIVEHKVGDAIRRHLGAERRSSTREISAERSDVDASAPQGREPTASGVAVAREERQELLDVIAGMPEAYQHMLRLVHGQHCSVKEAALLMGKSDAAARKLYGRALAGLGRRLDRDQRATR